MRPQSKPGNTIRRLYLHKQMILNLMHTFYTTLPMRISAKNLGILALPDCCPCCFWMRAKLAWKSPWAIMPGIFSSIDGYSKRAILAFFETNGHFPPWIAGRWADVRPLPTPHHSTFRLTDPETGIVLTGVPDLMLGLPRRRLAILDLKTARYSKHQDALLPMYQVQLVGYALIAESLGMGTVEALGLVYGEPPPNDKMMVWMPWWTIRGSQFPSRQRPCPSNSTGL